MSHELRTPLNGIISTLDLLSEGDRTQEECEFLDIAKQSAESLAMIEQILDVTSLDNDQLTLQPRSFWISGELETTLAILAESAKAKELELNWRTTRGSPGW